MMITLTLLALCSLIGVQSAPEFIYSCPDNYVLYGALNQCHQVSTSEVTWIQAVDDCKDLNGYLAKIDSKAENNYLSDDLVSESFWIGLNDLAVEDTFVYSGAPDASVPYENWAFLEPSGTYLFKKESCAVVKSNGNWNDKPCDDESDKFKFVCETEVIKTLTCPKGWVSNDDDQEEIYACYKIVEEKVDYETAKSACEAIQGAHLFFPTTEAENDYVTGEVGKDHWIGIDDLADEGKFVTVDNQTLEYENWSFGQPNNNLLLFWEDEDCATSSHGLLGVGGWNDKPCKDNFSYVCKTNQ